MPTGDLDLRHDIFLHLFDGDREVVEPDLDFIIDLRFIEIESELHAVEQNRSALESQRTTHSTDSPSNRKLNETTDECYRGDGLTALDFATSIGSILSRNFFSSSIA